MSALAPALRDGTQSALIAWLDQHTASLYLPTVVVAEITSGIAKLNRAGAQRRADAFQARRDAIIDLYAARILPLDIAAARAAGLLQEKVRALGLDPGFADLAIAGIAVARGMTLLTRNPRHFAPLGIPALDPYATLPE